MATHSSVLAWRVPWAEEPGGLQSMGSQRAGHEWVANTFTFSLFVCFVHIELLSSLLMLSSAVFRLPLNMFFTSAIVFSYSKILICFFFRVFVSLLIFPTSVGKYIQPIHLFL